MEINQFKAGSEKRFFDFIGKLDDGKTALISHNDLDGLISAKVANEALHADYVDFVNYEDLNDSLVTQLKKKKFKKIVFTDLNITDEHFVKALEHFADVLIIDHHLITKDWNSEKTTFVNVQGHCTAYLNYYLFSKTQDLEKMDWLVALASVSDWCYFDNQGFMKRIYEKYGDKFVIEDKKIRMNGKFWDMQWNLNLALIYFKDNLRKVYESLGVEFGNVGNLMNYTRKIQEELDFIVSKFEDEKEGINGGYFYQYKSKFDLGSIVINVISGNNYDKTIVTVYPTEGGYKISIRRQDGKLNVADYLKAMLTGFDNTLAGGHAKAAGGSIMKEDLEEFKERLRRGS